MASAASRQAAKQRALESVLNLFGDAKKGKAGGKGGGDGSQNMSAMIASLKRAEPIPGLEGLLEDPPAQKVATEKVYESRSLMLFRPADWPRRPAIFMVESKAFDQLILLTILTNCVTMAWESPLDPDVGPKAMFINVSRYTIAALRPADVFPLRAPRAPNFYSLLLLLARTTIIAPAACCPGGTPYTVPKQETILGWRNDFANWSSLLKLCHVFWRSTRDLAALTRALDLAASVRFVVQVSEVEHRLSLCTFCWLSTCRPSWVLVSAPSSDRWAGSGLATDPPPPPLELEASAEDVSAPALSASRVVIQS